LLPEIAAVQLQQIERIHARRRMSPVKQRKEVGLAVTASGDQFTIDDAESRLEPEESCRDPREAAG
jgi:hypothetical protein